MKATRRPTERERLPRQFHKFFGVCCAIIARSETDKNFKPVSKPGDLTQMIWWLSQSSGTINQVTNPVKALTAIIDQERISSYNIKWVSDEDEENYQLGDYWLIRYQILS